jgi:hypothetical protein
VPAVAAVLSVLVALSVAGVLVRLGVLVMLVRRQRVGHGAVVTPVSAVAGVVVVSCHGVAPRSR